MMNVTYTKTMGRKILLIFLTFTIVFSITALIVQKNIVRKLNDVSNLATDVEHDQSKPEQALLLLRQAEDDFQAALVNKNNQKIVSYKEKLSRAFNEIDTMLREQPYTANLTSGQNIQMKSWYKRKMGLSYELYSLRHSFDSLLTVYTGLQGQIPSEQNSLKTDVRVSKSKRDNSHADTSKVASQHQKGLIKRIKDAIANKNDGYSIQVNSHKNTVLTYSKTQKILAENRNAYVEKLQNLQQQNSRLLHMQLELNRLNTYISNELEGIIGGIKDINYNMAFEFKETALKNYQETTVILNGFYMIAFFLLLAFAISLIVFIDQLNKAEVHLRKENELSVHTAQQKIDELLKKIMLEENKRSPAKMEELKEIVELAMNDNPAFLTKFNEFDVEFSKNLLNIAPNLVASEIEFCALLRLNFDTKEIARYTKSSVRAAEGKKYRIRKKLSIPSDRDINVWMTRI